MNILQPLRFLPSPARLLCALGLVYLAVALTYSLNTPLFEGADEPAHFEYILNIAHGQGLPMFHIDLPRRVNYEAHQPPLYYAVGALAIGWINTDDYGSLAHQNPHATYDPLELTNRNLFVHTRREGFPYEGAVLAVHVARLLSLLCGLGTLIATFGFARVLFPSRSYLWIGSAAFVGFLPQFTFLSGTVTNDTMLTFVCALALWQLARVVVQLRSLTTRGVLVQFWLLGVLVGLGPLAKESALVLLPFSILVLAVSAWVSQSPSVRQANAHGIVLVLLMFLVLASWWYVLRHEQLGFWLGSSDSAGPPSGEVLSLQGLLDQWTEVEISFWGLFGWNTVPLPQIVYDGLHGFALIAVLGAVMGFFRRSTTVWERAWLAALAVFALVVLVAFLRWMSSTQQAHGRLLFAALPAFALICCWGLVQWLPRRAHVSLTAVFVIAWVALSAWCGSNLLVAAFPRPQWLSADSVPHTTLFAPVRFGEELQLGALELPMRALHANETFAAVLYWQSLKPSLDKDYTITLQLFAPDGRRLAQVDTFPVRGMYPTSQWLGGQWLRDDYPLTIATDAPAGTATLIVGVYDHTTSKALQVVQSDGRRVGRATIGQLEIR